MEYPPDHRDVHNNHEDCHDGKAIQAKHKVPGTGGKSQCKVCVTLG
jgi:hypothetical protein